MDIVRSDYKYSRHTLYLRYQKYDTQYVVNDSPIKGREHSMYLREIKLYSTLSCECSGIAPCLLL